MRIYLGGPMFTRAEALYNLALTSRLRDAGYSVYCPNESEPINDKSQPAVSPQTIYRFDIEALEESNLLICQVSEDSGTNWEAGYFDCLSRHVDPARYYGVLGLATDMRLQTIPDATKVAIENQAFHVNALVAGGLLSSLGVCYDEDELFARLADVRAEREG
jgi:nucleoside 2-deoxyribosyltransferase